MHKSPVARLTAILASNSEVNFNIYDGENTLGTASTNDIVIKAAEIDSQQMIILLN